MEIKILEELMRCGAVGMDVEKSCAIVEISEDEFYASPEAQKAYRTGQYKGDPVRPGTDGASAHCQQAA